MSKLTVCLLTLCMLATPVLATPAPQATPPPAKIEPTAGPAKKAASADELEQYAARERTAEKLAKFEGGRGNDTLITVILILVIVILVLAII